jgi:hypothetical protein
MVRKDTATVQKGKEDFAGSAYFLKIHFYTKRFLAEKDSLSSLGLLGHSGRHARSMSLPTQVLTET